MSDLDPNAEKLLGDGDVLDPVPGLPMQSVVVDASFLMVEVWVLELGPPMRPKQSLSKSAPCLKVLG